MAAALLAVPKPRTLTGEELVAGRMLGGPSRPPHCYGCPYKTSKTVASYGPVDADICLLGEAPGSEELVSGIPFKGMTGNLTRKAFAKAGKPDGLDGVRLINAMSCRPPKGTQPKQMEPAIMACRERVLSELHAHPYTVVVAAGASALKSILGKRDVFIRDNRGRAFLLDGTKSTYVVPTLHPAALLYAETSIASDYRNLLLDLKYVIDIANGSGLKNPGETKYIVADTRSLAERAVRGLIKHEYLAADIETGGGGKIQLNPRLGYILCLSVSYAKNRSVVFPFDAFRENRDLLHLLFDTQGPKWIWHNGKFDSAFLRQEGVVARVDHDSMLAHYSLQETGEHDLETLAGQYLGAIDYKAIILQYLKSRTDDFAKVPKDVLYKYNAWDTDYTYQLFFMFMERLKKIPSIRSYENILIPASALLQEVEANGLPVDVYELDRVDKTLTGKIAEANDAMQRAVQGVWDPIQYARQAKSKTIPKFFNPASSKQVHWLLYKKMGLKPSKKLTKGSGYDTTEYTLTMLPENPITEELLRFRNAKRSKSTNVVGIRKRLEADSCVHSTLLIQRTATGRLSSREPNIQNIPGDPRIKRIFTAPPGFRFVELDYSQAELRILALFAQDEFLMKCFVEKRQLHHEVARELFGKYGWTSESLESDDPEIRTWAHDTYLRAKALNFGVAYGREAFSLSVEHDISIAEAQGIIDAWFAKAHGAHRYLQSLKNLVAAGKPVVSPLGRMRRFGLVTKNTLHEFQNEACNFPMQGVASDLTLISAIQANETLKRRFKSKIVNLVHDSILQLMPDDDRLAYGAARYLQNVMVEMPTQLLNSNVPFVADCKMGYHWGNLNEVDLAHPKRMTREAA